MRLPEEHDATAVNLASPRRHDKGAIPPLVRRSQDGSLNQTCGSRRLKKEYRG
jgi:hypothetical protein